MTNPRRQKLFESYPALFALKDQPDSKKLYPISFGLEHGDGWLPIIEDLCFRIQHHIDWKKEKSPGTKQPQIQQVKEKFGTLRFYIDSADDYIDGLVAMAESESSRTCEDCGVPGTMRNKGWIRVRCDPCEEKRSQRLKEET